MSSVLADSVARRQDELADFLREVGEDVRAVDPTLYVQTRRALLPGSVVEWTIALRAEESSAEAVLFRVGREQDQTLYIVEPGADSPDRKPVDFDGLRSWWSTAASDEESPVTRLVRAYYEVYCQLDSDALEELARQIQDDLEELPAAELRVEITVEDVGPGCATYVLHVRSAEGRGLPLCALKLADGAVTIDDWRGDMLTMRSRSELRRWWRNARDDAEHWVASGA